uniref:Uncharacterized protein n=1 Tax=Timema genevievae TaxID=629358 RepID=A0A7R9PQQ4_TIMGE|nr:unnamed protein product [Timema genevievae]
MVRNPLPPLYDEALPEDLMKEQLLDIRNGKSLADPMHKISLRSRAEREIVNDAKLKRVVSQMCEDQYLGADRSEDSLANLRGLQYLDLCGCNRITDVSMKHAFFFRELQYLNLSQCQQFVFWREVDLQRYLCKCGVKPKMRLGLLLSHDSIKCVQVKRMSWLSHDSIKCVQVKRMSWLSHDSIKCVQISFIGLSFLAARNPSIETLIMSQCYNVTDNGIISVSKFLSRLKHLEVQRVKAVIASQKTGVHSHCPKRALERVTVLSAGSRKTYLITNINAHVGCYSEGDEWGVSSQVRDTEQVPLLLSTTGNLNIYTSYISCALLPKEPVLVCARQLDQGYSPDFTSFRRIDLVSI